MDFYTIKSNLEILEGLDRLNYLIDLSKMNPGVPENYKTSENRIIGCVSTAYLILDQTEPTVMISTESDSDFVKGLLYILKLYINNKTINEILKIDEVELMNEIGIKNAITSQRINGFYSAINTLKKLLKNDN